MPEEHFCQKKAIIILVVVCYELCREHCKHVEVGVVVERDKNVKCFALYIKKIPFMFTVPCCEGGYSIMVWVCFSLGWREKLVSPEKNLLCGGERLNSWAEVYLPAGR